jgi:hypothetical protein
MPFEMQVSKISPIVLSAYWRKALLSACGQCLGRLLDVGT